MIYHSFGSGKQITIQSIDKKAMLIMKGFHGLSGDDGLSFEVTYRFDERTPLFLNGIRYKLEEHAEFRRLEKIMRTQAVASRCGARQTDTKKEFSFFSTIQDFTVFIDKVRTIIKEGETEAVLFDKCGGLDKKEISLKLKKVNEKETGIYLVYNNRYSNEDLRFMCYMTITNKDLHKLYRTGTKICKEMAAKLKEVNKLDPLFPSYEYAKRRALCALMDDWKREVSTAQVLYRHDGKYYPGDTYFCADGFYPNYFSQKKRILFIAREAVDLSGCDYIPVMLQAYQENNVGGKSVNAALFHARLMYLAYGILQGKKIPYDELPKASRITVDFGVHIRGVSFAFMELSKYSNDNADAGSHCDTQLMLSFLRDSHLEKRNFVREEIKLLEPDVILTMNLWGCGIPAGILESALGRITEIDSQSYQPYATLSTLTVNRKQIPLIDLFHLTSRKSTETAVYEPVMQIMQRIGMFSL
jgi:hypothetical protein